MDKESLEEEIENTEKQIRELNELLDAHNNAVLKIFEEYLQSLNN
jgi:ferritin-like metal-binding protein YciE